MSTDSPIFVLSTGRCGTLALQRFFNRSEGIEAFHRYRGRHAEYRNDMSILLEQNYTFYRVYKGAGNRQSLRSTMIDRLRNARGTLVRRLRSEDKRFVELNHEFSPFALLLPRAYPDARFVHLVRDPVEVVASFLRKFSPPPMALPAYFGTRYSLKGQCVLRYGHVRTLASLGPSWLGDWVESHRYDKHLHPFVKRGGDWVEDASMDPFEKTCWYWREINELVRELFSGRPDEDTLTVRSGELFRREGTALRSLVEFVDPPGLGVDELSEFLTRRYNPKSVKTDFPPPAEWDADRLDVLRRYCGETARALGVPAGRSV